LLLSLKKQVRYSCKKKILMRSDSDISIDLIKKKINAKTGHSISYAKDCLILSGQIMESTRRTISVSTLKRFFGIIKSPYKPSMFTLDTLSIFLGYQNFADLAEASENSCKADSWDQLKEQARVITAISLNSLTTKIGSKINAYSLRKFADEKFDAFLHSSGTVTAFIAPDGYGKSTTIVQLAGKYFTGPHPLYPNDILCLIDGGILYNLIIHHEEADWFYNLFEYDPQRNLNISLRKNHGRVKGRFILVIDGIGEIYPDNARTEHFVDNLMKIAAAYEKVNWFKLVITCHPAKWKIFSFLVRKNPLLKALWYDAEFDCNPEEAVNIPLFDKNEIEEVLAGNKFPYALEELKFYNPEIQEVINNPYLLNLFIASFNHGQILDETDLLYQFVHKSVLSPPFVEEKYAIINAFFQICGNGLQGNFVKKEALSQLTDRSTAYEELIQKGILHEYTIPDHYLAFTTYIEFSHKMLFEFLLANKLLKENESQANRLLQIVKGYRENPALQCNILKFIIKIAFKEENMKLLEHFFGIIDLDRCKKETAPEEIFRYAYISNIFAVELRRNKTARELLIPFISQSKSGSYLLFERCFDMDSIVLHSADNLKYYLRYNHSAKTILFSHYIKFMQSFLSCSKKDCDKEYAFFVNLDSPPEEAPELYFMTPIIYQSVFTEKIDRELINKALNISEQLRNNEIQSENSFIPFDFFIIDALDYGKMNREIITFANHVLEKDDQLPVKSTCFYQFFLSVYARALLNTGQSKEGIQLFKKVKLKEIPEIMENYIRIRYKLTDKEFASNLGEL